MPVDADMAAVQSGPIAVVPYDKSWPAAFERVRETIGDTLGTIGFDAHHIGSTAVPGLCAKPRIDIDIVVQVPDDLARSVDLLRQTNRNYHGDPYRDGMWTFTSHRTVTPGHRLYLCAPGTPTHLKRILFRDYLRAHPEVAAAYGALKRKLVLKSGGDWKAYTNGKSAFVADVLSRAISAQSE